MKQLLLYALIATTFMACKKEIDVDLGNAAPQIVIEGSVTNTSNAEVTISKSVPFSNSNTFPGISGAIVNITDETGAKYTLTETKPGSYTNQSLIGLPGKTYKLLVNVEGKEYTASSTMPTPVNLDTLLLEKLFWGTESIWVVKPQYKDPGGLGNNYMFTEKINGKLYPDFWVWDDRVINNSISTIPLMQGDSTINTNDTIEVEMRCIDKNTLRYFTALQGTQDNMTTPANAENKITGGALGYFSAYTQQRKKIKVQ